MLHPSSPTELVLTLTLAGPARAQEGLAGLGGGRGLREERSWGETVFARLEEFNSRFNR